MTHRFRAGWFSVVCSSLRDKTKYPDKTLPLFHCPGRLPEQAENMAPLPWDSALYHNNTALYKQRVDGFRACGRFLGLALWFKQTLPIKLCRHVWKYLLGKVVKTIHWYTLINLLLIVTKIDNVFLFSEESIAKAACATKVASVDKVEIADKCSDKVESSNEAESVARVESSDKVESSNEAESVASSQ